MPRITPVIGVIIIMPSILSACRVEAAPLSQRSFLSNERTANGQRVGGGEEDVVYYDAHVT